MIRGRLPARAVCLTILAISVFNICRDLYHARAHARDNRAIAAVYHGLSETAPDSAGGVSPESARLEELRRENADIVGWLTIPGTGIDYPVLQTTDNEYYLTHNYKKEYSESGSIFLDKDVDLEKPSANLLIYGHRNRNGLMFEALANYTREDFYRQHPVIRFATLKGTAEYEIIAVLLSRVYYKNETGAFRYYSFIDAEGSRDFESYVNGCIAASLYGTGETAEYGDQLLTLSTCEYSQKDGRLAVVARKTPR